MRFDSQLEISEELLSSREELKGTRYYSPKLQQNVHQVQLRQNIKIEEKRKPKQNKETTKKIPEHLQ